MALLSLCPQLVDLDVSILNTESATPPSTIALTLYFLESLSIPVSTPSILPHLTLPRLRKLTLKELCPEHATVLQALLQRSSCSLEALCISCSWLSAESVRAWNIVLPHSIASLDMTWRHTKGPTSIFDLLSSTEILPGLKTMKLRGGRISALEYVALPNMLRARCEVSDSRPVALAYFDTSLACLHTQAGFEPMVMPTSLMASWNSAAVIAPFKALADGGLRMHIELITRGPRSPATAFIVSQGTGLTCGSRPGTPSAHGVFT
ncbi:hypothetical protein C8J57DRAFT_1509684 [Mycena rebaudengoi]|nr:hypothetical protein C8J57DRAFT_1509684 [Mycena rebaudengoi]